MTSKSPSSTMSDNDRKNGASTGRNASGRFTTGNPGRKPGARHKATRAALSLLDGEAEALSRKAVELALGGDAAALRLCLERIEPSRVSRRLLFVRRSYNERNKEQVFA